MSHLLPRNGNKHSVMTHRRRKMARSSTGSPITVAGVGPNHSAVTPLAASAPGITNSLGADEDPSPLTYYDSNGNQAYLFPTVDFGHNVSIFLSLSLFSLPFQ